MVYFGPSRACLTCKRRRKKCDETRPSCMRCLTANRTCGGYEAGDDFEIREYQCQNGTQKTFKSMARKCSLTVRTYIPGTNHVPTDGLPKEIHDGEADERSIQSFLYEYCGVVPVSRQASHGFLAGLEPLILDLGLESDLANACRAVAFASGSVTLRRPLLMRRAEMMYQDSLEKLVRAVVDPVLAGSPEMLAMAIVLGLYEMIIAQEESHEYHLAHVRGVAALLRIESDCPLALLKSNNWGGPLVMHGCNTNIFSIPSPNTSTESLDDLLVKFGSLWDKATTALRNSTSNPSNFHTLREATIALDRDFAHWQSTRAEIYKPTTIGHVHQPRTKLSVGFWPGRVDMYHDLYIAAAWNTFRIARLLILHLITRMSDVLNTLSDHCSQDRTREEADCLIADMLASIPYHLTADLHIFLRNADRGATKITNPGRPVGGLLLMDSLRVVLQLSVVPLWVKGYVCDCLTWIGINMGIGQALVCARATAESNIQCFGRDRMIMWAGFLV